MPNWTSKTAPKGTGRHPKKFFYGYYDIAWRANLTLKTVYNHASRGVFDPYDIQSVCQYVRQKSKRRGK